MSGHRFANLIDALGRPYRTLAILERTDDSMIVQPAGIDGAVIPGTEPRPISPAAPLRLFHTARAAYEQRGLGLYATPRNTD